MYWERTAAVMFVHQVIQVLQRDDGAFTTYKIELPFQLIATCEVDKTQWHARVHGFPEARWSSGTEQGARSKARKWIRAKVSAFMVSPEGKAAVAALLKANPRYTRAGGWSV